MKTFSALFFAAATAVLFAGCNRTADKPFDAAHAAAAQGDWRTAYLLAEKAERVDPRNQKGLLLLAVAADKCGKTDRALDAAHRAVQLDGHSFAALYTFGRLCAARADRRAEGLRTLQKAHEINPSDAGTMVLIANAAMAMNHPNSAQYLLELQKYGEYRNSAEIDNNLAIVHLRAGKIDEAKAAFIRARNAAPGNPSITLNVARFFDYHTQSANFARSQYATFLKQAGDKPEFRRDAEIVRKHLQQR